MLNHSLLAYQDTNLNFINDADVPGCGLGWTLIDQKLLEVGVTWNQRNFHSHIMKVYCFRVKNNNGKQPPAGYFGYTSPPTLAHFVQTVKITIFNTVNVFHTSWTIPNNIKALYQLYSFFILLRAPEINIEGIFLLHRAKIA